MITVIAIESLSCHDEPQPNYDFYDGRDYLQLNDTSEHRTTTVLGWWKFLGCRKPFSYSMVRRESLLTSRFTNFEGRCPSRFKLLNVWLCKWPSHGFYPSPCTLILSFFPGHSISAEVGDHCSTPKSKNSGARQGSVVSPTSSCYFLMSFSFTQTALSPHTPTSLFRNTTIFSISDPPNRNWTTQGWRLLNT